MGPPRSKPSLVLRGGRLPQGSAAPAGGPAPGLGLGRQDPRPSRGNVDAHAAASPVPGLAPSPSAPPRQLAVTPRGVETCRLRRRAAPWPEPRRLAWAPSRLRPRPPRSFPGVRASLTAAVSLPLPSFLRCSPAGPAPVGTLHWGAGALCGGCRGIWAAGLAEHGPGGRKAEDRQRPGAGRGPGGLRCRVSWPRG